MAVLNLLVVLPASVNWCSVFL